MKNLWRVLCLAVFVTGVVSFSQTPTKNKDWRDQIEPAVPYTIISADYTIDSNGVKSVVGNRIRYVKPNGEWKQMRYDPRTDATSTDQANINKDTAVFASTENGVVAKAPGRAELKSISGLPDQLMQDCFRSAICLSKQPDFVRIDEVAGIQVYVLRTEIKDTTQPLEWIEQSYSPKTGYMMLRIARHFRDGSEMGAEAVKVEFKDVPDNLNDDLKGLPVKK